MSEDIAELIDRLDKTLNMLAAFIDSQYQLNQAILEQLENEEKNDFTSLSDRADSL